MGHAWILGDNAEPKCKESSVNVGIPDRAKLRGGDNASRCKRSETGVAESELAGLWKGSMNPSLT